MTRNWVRYGGEVLIVVGSYLVMAGVTGDPATGLGGSIGASLYLLYQHYRQLRGQTDDSSTDDLDATEEASA